MFVIAKLRKSCDKVAIIEIDVMNFGEYIAWLKLYCTRKRMSQEEFVDNLLYALVENENIKDKEGNDFHLDKTRVSRIVNHKDDTPEALRKPLNKFNIEERLESDFDVFIESYIDLSKKEALTQDVIKIINDCHFEQTKMEPLLSNNIKRLLLIIFIHSLKQSNRLVISENTTIWENGNNYLRVIPGDIFKYGFDKRNRDRRIVVIPVNTSFETRITYDTERNRIPYVSAESLHGNFLSRVYKGGTQQSELKKRILKSLGIKDSDLPTSIGAVASLFFDPVIFYLLAVSDFDNENVAHSNLSNIETAIGELITYYDKKGQGFNVYIPLIGTGLSRAYLSNQESYEVIKEALLKRKAKLQGKINIVILPEIFQKIEL